MGKIIILIGGTGTLGNAILPILLADQSIRRIRILSRGEHVQKVMEEKFHGERIDYLLGDVADTERIEVACRGVDELYHFAAIKHVDKAEKDPGQAVKTNVLGTLNVVRACIRNFVSKAILTSTDKACAPVNTYGATKLLAENLFIAGNIGNHSTRFSAVRYGNVLSSQGSVFKVWKEQKAQGKRLTLTNPLASRFFITPAKAAQFVYDCMQDMTGAELCIPKMKSIYMQQMVDLIDHPYDITGMRPGEKMCEYLISDDEKGLVTELPTKYIKYPEYNLFPVTKRGSAYRGGPVSSDNAPKFSTEELSSMLNEVSQ